MSSDYHRQYYSRKAARLCVTCAQPLPEGYAHVYCAACLERERNRVIAKQHERYRMGICIQCGKEKRYGKSRLCAKCNLKNSEKQHELYLRKKEREKANEDQQG